MINWHLEKRKISELKNWEKNPRTITEKAFKELEKSVDALGNFEPLVINIDGTVIAGNQRLRLEMKRGNNEVDVYVPERELSEEEVKKIGVISNRHSGDWDMDILANEFDDVLKDLGFDDLLPELVMEVSEDDYEEPEQLPSKVQLGEVWQLGKHRLMCGDSTKIEDVERLMNGQKAILAFNDPPYGMKKENEGVMNDNLNYKDLLEFNREWIALQFTYLIDVGSWYCWGTDEPLMDIYSNILKPYIETQKATFRNLITWDKGVGQGQLSDGFKMYPIADEKCLFVMLGVRGFNNNADNYFEGWEPVRNYLLEGRKEMGWDVPTMKRIAGHSDLRRDHWTGKSQFNFPTQKVYKAFQEEVRRIEEENKKEYTAFKKEYTELKKEYTELKKEYYSSRAYFDNTHDNQNNVWHFNRDTQNTDHATPKPIELCARAVKSSCPINGLVTDWFGGSGSTLIACEQTDRICYMMELDTHYCDVIIDRWEKLTGQVATKL